MPYFKDVRRAMRVKVENATFSIYLLYCIFPICIFVIDRLPSWHDHFQKCVFLAQYIHPFQYTLS